MPLRDAALRSAPRRHVTQRNDFVGRTRIMTPRVASLRIVPLRAAPHRDALQRNVTIFWGSRMYDAAQRPAALRAATHRNVM